MQARLVFGVLHRRCEEMGLGGGRHEHKAVIG